MKIAVDCFEVHDRVTGVGRVIHNLLANLTVVLPHHEFYVFSCENRKTPQNENVRQVTLPSHHGYLRWQNGPFFKQLKKIQPELLIASNYILPLFGRWRSILIEHDISFVSHPEWYSKKETLLKRVLVKRSLAKSSVILTVSEFSKQEIMKYFRVDGTKIRVVYHGVEDRFRAQPRELVESWKSRQGLRGKTIIGFLGSMFNRRNIPVLVNAAALLRQEFPEIVLYLVGRDLTRPSQNIPELLAKDWIVWKESIPEEEITLFYSACDVFAYLSEYEGFGLPPLEALACGRVPVLLSKTSLSEIYQDLAVMVEEASPERVREALNTAVSDESVRRRILDGFRRRRQEFSWRNAAEKVAEVIDALFPAETPGKKGE